MNQNLKQKTIGGLLYKSIERVGLQGISLIISIILARILAPENYGNVSLILVFVTIFDVVVNYGLGNSLIQKRDSDNLDFSTCLISSVFFTTIVYVILFLTSPYIAEYYGNSSLSLMLRVLGIRILFSGVNSIQIAYVAKYFLFKKSMVSSLIATCVSGIVGILMAYCGCGEWALIAQSILAVVVNVVVLYFLIPLKFTFSFSIKRLVALLDYGWKLLLIGFSNTLYDEIRSLLIAKTYTTEDLAYYDRGRNLPKLISNNINAIIDNVMFSTMSIVQDEKERLLTVLSYSIMASLYFLSPMLFGMAMVSDELIVLLYTEKWIEASSYLKIFCFSFIFTPVITLELNAIKSIGKSSIALMISLLTQAVGLILMFLSLKFGVIYLACSTVVSNFINCIIYMLISKRILKFGIIKQLSCIVKELLPGGLMCIVLLLVPSISSSPLIMLMLKVVIGCFTFIIFSSILKNNIFVLFLNRVKERKKHG